MGDRVVDVLKIGRRSVSGWDGTRGDAIRLMVEQIWIK